LTSQYGKEKHVLGELALESNCKLFRHKNVVPLHSTVINVFDLVIVTVIINDLTGKQQLSLGRKLFQIKKKLDNKVSANCDYAHGCANLPIIQ
jgi:hypothetical protein